MGSMGIMLVVDDGFYVCICNFYSSIFKIYTQHAFVYDSHFSQSDNSGYFGTIIYNISYAPICVLEGKY